MIPSGLVALPAVSILCQWQGTLSAVFVLYVGTSASLRTRLLNHCDSIFSLQFCWARRQLVFSLQGSQPLISPPSQRNLLSWGRIWMGWGCGRESFPFWFHPNTVLILNSPPSPKSSVSLKPKPVRSILSYPSVETTKMEPVHCFSAWKKRKGKSDGRKKLIYVNTSKISEIFKKERGSF